jgi:hypothetical protein
MACQATVESVPICDTESVPPVLVDNRPMTPVIVAPGRETIARTEAPSAPIPVRVVLVTAIPLLTPPPLFGPGRPYPGAGSSGL